MHPGAGGCSSDRVGPNVTISEGLSVMLLLNHPLKSFKQLLEEAIETTKAEGGRGRVTSIDAEGEAVALVEMEVLSYSTRWLANGTVAGIEMEFAADVFIGFNSSKEASMLSSTLMNAFRQPPSDSFLGESEVKHMVLAVPSSDVGALQTPKILAQTLTMELADAGLLEDSHTEGFSYAPKAQMPSAHNSPTQCLTTVSPTSGPTTSPSASPSVPPTIAEANYTAPPCLPLSACTSSSHHFADTVTDNYHRYYHTHDHSNIHR